MPAECSHQYRARKKALKNSANPQPPCSTLIEVQAKVHEENSSSDLSKKQKH